MLRLHELFIAIFILEEIDENFRIGLRQAQLAVDLFAQVAQILEERLLTANFDVGEKHELRHADRVFARHARARLLIGSFLLCAGSMREQIAATNKWSAAEHSLQKPAEPSGNLHALLALDP